MSSTLRTNLSNTASSVNRVLGVLEVGNLNLYGYEPSIKSTFEGSLVIWASFSVVVGYENLLGEIFNNNCSWRLRIDNDLTQTELMLGSSSGSDQVIISGLIGP